MFGILQIMESKGIDQTTSPIAPKPIERWDYNNYFKEYLLLLASKGNVALESLTKYPETIELSKGWHQTLNQMRESTRNDGREKWALAGFKSEKRGIFLPTIPISGLSDYVPSETMMKMIDWARDKHDINPIGNLHSHPNGSEHKSIFGNKHKLVEDFSAGDFYHLIVDNFYFMGITAGNYNVFAFKAKESRGLGVSSSIFSQENFEKVWYEKYGFKYLGSVEKFGAERAIPTSNTADPIGMNLAIAKRHGLVLYQGEAKKDLVKIFPQ
jgi:hypothetical protein